MKKLKLRLKVILCKTILRVLFGILLFLYRGWFKIKIRRYNKIKLKHPNYFQDFKFLEFRKSYKCNDTYSIEEASNLAKFNKKDELIQIYITMAAFAEYNENTEDETIKEVVGELRGMAFDIEYHSFQLEQSFNDYEDAMETIEIFEEELEFLEITKEKK